MIIKRMIKEEWRMHSELFSGRSFAFFPVIILAISYFAFWMIARFSILEVQSVSRGLIFLGVFFGLSVASIGFSSKDAIKNVLGPTNFLVYSSRTLPVDERKLLAAFLFKDLVYYTALFLAPIAVGGFLVAGLQVFTGIAGMLGGFVAGLAAGVLLARTSLRLPGLNWRYVGWDMPLTGKTILDVSRSAGGFFKIFFSLTILTGFYWFTALYFPSASAFLRNPVLSFSVLLGIVSLTVYNWINRFDSIEDYLYLPVDSGQLLGAKQKAFLLISIPLTGLFLFASFFIYPPSAVIALLSLVTSLSVQFYTAGLASYLTGLEPNSRLFDSKIFMEYLILNSVFILPLLAFSVFFVPRLWPYFILMSIVPGAAGALLLRKSQEKLG